MADYRMINLNLYHYSTMSHSIANLLLVCLCANQDVQYPGYIIINFKIKIKFSGIFEPIAKLEIKIKILKLKDKVKSKLRLN